MATLAPHPRTTAQQQFVRAYICGGLGNQMLQYAAGRALALRLGLRLRLDLSFFGRDRHRAFELDRFPIHAEWDTLPQKTGLAARFLRAVAASGRLPRFEPASTRFDAAYLDLNQATELRGYFFSEKYFLDYADTIRQELTPPEPSDPQWTATGKQMTQEGVASLHIRRGDYVSNAKAAERFAHCPIEYYLRAMAQLPAACPVYVFSDDIAWAQKNLPPERPLVFVESAGGKDGLRDLWLMTQARHHIIANSSFSWWGAWLATTAGGKKIAPAKWYNDPTIDDQDMIPASWARL